MEICSKALGWADRRVPAFQTTDGNVWNLIAFERLRCMFQLSDTLYLLDFKISQISHAVNYTYLSQFNTKSQTNCIHIAKMLSCFDCKIGRRRRSLTGERTAFIDSSIGCAGVVSSFAWGLFHKAVITRLVKYSCWIDCFTKPTLVNILLQVRELIFSHFNKLSHVSVSWKTSDVIYTCILQVNFGTIVNL